MFEWTETNFGERTGWKAQLTNATQMLITETGENQFQVNVKISGKTIIRKPVQNPDLISQLDVVLFAAKSVLTDLEDQKTRLYDALAFLENPANWETKWQETKDNWLLPVKDPIRVTITHAAPEAFAVKLIGPKRTLLAEQIIEMNINTPIPTIQRNCINNLTDTIREDIGHIKHAINIIKTEV